MTITQYIEELEKLKEKYGNIQVTKRTDHWSWSYPHYDKAYKPFIAHDKKVNEKVMVVNDETYED